MKTRAGHILLLSAFICFACSNHAKNKENDSNLPAKAVKLVEFASGLHSPVAATFMNDGTMLICEQTGLVRSIQNNKLNDKPFLDIQSKLVKLSGAYDERGLLGIALHPEYTLNKKFYVYYSASSSQTGSDHQSIISEFRASANPLEADPSSERILLTIPEPQSNHNGGDLHFGPDGYLYISVGDGGGAGDKHGSTGNGQNLNTLLGKILRIDVNAAAGYKIPADNPFVNKKARPEIWAYGLRNPWRFSFDNETGLLFAADVGQNKFEEVNIIEKGGNYGWRIMEASHCFYPEENCKTEGLEFPIAEYDHDTGISIAGGYVYNGKFLPELKGTYIFADWNGSAFYLKPNSVNGKTIWKKGDMELIEKPAGDLKILSFAEGNDGELYMLTNSEVGPKGTNGAIYKLVKP